MHISLGCGCSQTDSEGACLDPETCGTVSIVSSGGGSPSGPVPGEAEACAASGWIWDTKSNSCVPGGTMQDPATSCPVKGSVLAGGVCINPTPAAPSNVTTYLMLGFAAIAAIAIAGSFHR